MRTRTTSGALAIIAIAVAISLSLSTRAWADELARVSGHLTVVPCSSIMAFFRSTAQLAFQSAVAVAGTILSLSLSGQRSP